MPLASLHLHTAAFLVCRSLGLVHSAPQYGLKAGLKL